MRQNCGRCYQDIPRFNQFTSTLGLPTFSRLVNSLDLVDIFAPSLNVPFSSTSTSVQVSEQLVKDLRGECEDSR